MSVISRWNEYFCRSYQTEMSILCQPYPNGRSILCHLDSNLMSILCKSYLDEIFGYAIIRLSEYFMSVILNGMCILAHSYLNAKRNFCRSHSDKGVFCETISGERIIFCKSYSDEVSFVESHIRME